MPPDNVETTSHTSLSVENLGPQAVIALRLLPPFDVLELNIPAFEVAKPTSPDDPTTTVFDSNWMKSLTLKIFRKLEHLLDEHDILDDNEHFTKLNELLGLPKITKKTFEHYFQINVVHLNNLFEIYPSQLLQVFTDFYAAGYQDRVIHFHLELVSAAYRHLKRALSISSPTLTQAPLKMEMEPRTGTITIEPDVPTSSSITENQPEENKASRPETFPNTDDDNTDDRELHPGTHSANENRNKTSAPVFLHRGPDGKTIATPD
jgi:hypothetical protein